jgi:hypothetical protein
MQTMTASGRAASEVLHLVLVVDVSVINNVREYSSTPHMYAETPTTYYCKAILSQEQYRLKCTVFLLVLYYSTTVQGITLSSSSIVDPDSQIRV